MFWQSVPFSQFSVFFYSLSTSSAVKTLLFCWLGARLLKRVNISDAAEADRIFSMLMGEDVDPRRKFIEENATYATIDT